MDPLLTALGIELTAGIAIETGKAVAGALLGWAKSDEIARLFTELDERFGAVPGLTATGLHPLREDTEFLQLLALFWTTGSFPRDEMVAVIEQHLGHTEEQTPRDLAEQLADAINLFSARARADDRELFAIEVFRQSVTTQLEMLRDQMGSRPVVRHITLDWAPPLTRDRLERMLGEAPSDLAPLEEALRGSDDPRQIIVGLVQHPPTWLAEASHRTWEALGDVAEAYALSQEASAAFEEAADRPGANRGALVARSAEHAFIAGNAQGGEALLAKARELDEQHAQVVMAHLRSAASPEERLTILDEAPSQASAPAQAALDVARATAQLEMGRWEDAEGLLDAVRASVPEHPALRELGPMLVLERNRGPASNGEQVDVPALREAASAFLRLRQDVLAAFRFSDAARLLARAVTALAMAGDRDEATALLGEIDDQQTIDREATIELMGAALAVGNPELARTLAPNDPQDDRERLAAAQAAAFSSDDTAAGDAITTLDLLLSSQDGAIRAEAAYARQVAALAEGIDPSTTAQGILENESPSLAALLAAQQVRLAGKYAQAEELLLPHQDDIRVLRELVRWAGKNEQWDRVLELSRAVVSRQPLPLDRLIFADALYRGGDHHQAVSELVALRQDDNAPRDIRRDAFAYSTQIASEASDFSALERIAREWLGFDPSDRRAGWRRIYALLRLARSEEALEMVSRLQLEPETIEEAELLAAVLEESDEVESAVRRIAELSDRFGRPERLEAQFLISALMVRPEDRLEDLREQIRERLAAFPENFPDSKLIRSVPIDTSSPEGIDAFFREHIEPGAEEVQQIAEQVRDGEAPIAALATAVGKPASVVALQMPVIPLAFGDQVLRDLEEESAAQAITRAVVWDPISLAVVAGLPHEIGELIRLAFPASSTAQAALDDLHRAADYPSRSREEHSVIGYDAASGQRFLHEVSAEDVTRERDAVERAIEIAQRLEITPDVDPSRPTELDEFLAVEGRDSAFVTWPAAVAAAQRERRPLYSDDRYVRAQARLAGIPAFGTVAVLDALRARDSISYERWAEARKHLRRRVAMGLRPTLEELLADARANSWLLTPELAFALFDPTNWAQLIVETFRVWAAFLRTAFAEAPDQLDDWVLRFLDAAKRNLPGRSLAFITQALLLIAWEPFHPGSRPFLQALIMALRSGKSVLGWYPDPVFGVAHRLAVMSGDARELHGVLARAFLGDVDFADQLSLMGIHLPRV
jgi:hypothetical protein